MREILKIKGLNKSFSDDYTEKVVLDDVNLTLYEGEILCVVGSSGCGKSTLLKQIAGFDSPDNGGVYLNGKMVTKPSINSITVFQDLNQLFPWKTVIENVIFPLKIHRIFESKEKRFEHGINLLEKVNLEDYTSYYPHQLSGGMKQRVAIARAFAISPQILLMDEPFGSLDVHTREELHRLLLNTWKKTDTTIIFVTHDINEAILLSDRIVIMDKSIGGIKDCIINNIERPRDKNSIEYQKLDNKIRNLI